ncbi:MAG: TRAP transporter small permease [Bacillota bacterium]|jgi:TRAP-type C4-dicarboxylate transport system permease small subunit
MLTALGKKLILLAGRVFTAVAVLTLVGIVVIITAGIIARYIFNSPFVWTEELALLLFVWLSFLSIGVSTFKRKHVVADFLVQNINQHYKEFFRLVFSILSMVFLCFVFWSSIAILPTLLFETAALRIPRTFYYYPMACVTPFMIIFYLLELSDATHNIRLARRTDTGKVEC